MKKYLVCILMLTPIFSWTQSITGSYAYLVLVNVGIFQLDTRIA